MLWILRVGLIGAAVLHVHAAYSLTILNRHARSVKYQSERDYQVANFASRTMRWTGIIVLLFLFWHLADLTWGWVNPGFQPRRCVPQRRRVAVERVPVALLYIVANIALGVHLFHGAWSLFQIVGLEQPEVQQVASGLRHRLRHLDRRRQRLVPDRRAGRNREES